MGVSRSKSRIVSKSRRFEHPIKRFPNLSRATETSYITTA